MLRDFHFPGDERPFAVLGRDLPLPDPHVRPAARDPPARPWLLLGVLVLAQIGYPLTAGVTRARLTVATVVLGCAAVGRRTRCSPGARGPARALVAVTTGGGFAIEALGVATGFPFGGYDYSGALGPTLAGVPLVIPLAWTWMAWPAWLAAAAADPGRARGRSPGWAGRLGPLPRPADGGRGLLGWADPAPALPGVPASR